MAASLTFASSTNRYIYVNASANGYTKMADQDANSTPWGPYSAEIQTSAYTKSRYRYRTLITYGPILYKFVFTINGYQKATTTLSGTYVSNLSLWLDPNDGKSYSVRVQIQPYSTVSKVDQLYVEVSSRSSPSAAWGPFRYAETLTVRSYTDTDYLYTESSATITAWTAPLRFSWSGRILTGLAVEDNLYANDWIRLANTAYKKANWRYQRDLGSWNYSVNVWSGKEVSASDYNTMAGYCGCYTRVNSGDLIYANTILALSNAVNNGL